MTENLAKTEPDDEADAERGVELGDNSIFEILFWVLIMNHIT